MIKKKDLVTLLSKRSRVPKTYIKPVIDVLGEVLIEVFVSGNGVIITDLGRFYVTDKKDHNGFDPARKEPIVIPAHKSIRFKPSKMLKEALNPLNN